MVRVQGFFSDLKCEEKIRRTTAREEAMLANMKAALAARGIRQVGLALALKIPASRLSEIVCERRQADPSLRTRIAEMLGANEEWLFSTVVRIPNSPASKAYGTDVPTFDEAAER